MLLVVLAAIVGVSAREAQAKRVPCSEVVSAIDAVTSRPGSDRADPLRIANRLGVDPAWVLHCAGIYGRRMARSLPPLTDEQREQMQEAWEADEDFEVEVDDRIQGPLEVEDERQPNLPPPPPLPGARGDREPQR